jgi:hypothetical protein
MGQRTGTPRSAAAPTKLSSAARRLSLFLIQRVAVALLAICLPKTGVAVAVERDATPVTEDAGEPQSQHNCSNENPVLCWL